MRIMLDTNIIISGLAFAGNERKLLNTAYRKNATLIISEYVALETKAVLKKKFPGKENLLDELNNHFKVEIAGLPSKEEITEAESIIREQKDAVILATALRVKPDIFVSGDLDFHTSKITSLINVMHSKEAVALIKYHKKCN